MANSINDALANYKYNSGNLNNCTSLAEIMNSMKGHKYKIGEIGNGYSNNLNTLLGATNTNYSLAIFERIIDDRPCIRITAFSIFSKSIWQGYVWQIDAGNYYWSDWIQLV